MGEVIRGLSGSSPLRRGLALGRLARSWEEVVGPALAGESAPAALDDRGLLVAVVTAARGAQVRFLADEIRRRANEMLGGQEIRAVRVTVGRIWPKNASHLRK